MRNIYFTDGSPEGFFTAVFDAYTDKDAFLSSSPALQSAIGDTFLRVSSCAEKSARVIKKLRAVDKNSLYETDCILRVPDAEKHKLLTDNPIDAVRTPKIDAEIYVFSEEESKRFVRAVMREKDIRVKTALLILIYLGLRKGELCGLTWGNVDLDKGIIHVAQQLKEKSGEGLALGKLKTKESKADLPLSPMLAGVLAEYRQLLPGLSGCRNNQT